MAERSERPQRSVAFAGLAQVAEIREASFQGRRHLVVPVVALVGDSVVRPMGSDGAEFVPLSVLQVAPGGWNGRPVLPNHPRSIDGAEAASANIPRTLELYSFGQIFNARVEDGRLKVDAWLDAEKAEAVGMSASRVVERCKAGEMVEVSIGALVVAERRGGTHRGEPYGWTWLSLVPDHLAMLPEGTAGACDNVMGCGAPRAAGSRKKEAPPMSAPVAIPSSASKPPAKVPAVARLRAAVRAALHAFPHALVDAAMGTEEAEEAAELIQYRTIRTMLGQAAESVSGAATAADALISAELAETPAEGAAEDSEETIEMAQLESIASYCMAAVSSLYSVASACYSLRYDMEHADDGDSTTVVVVDSGYSAEKVRALAGARHSKEDRETIQNVHDMSVDLGASCATDKNAAAASKPPCGCGKERQMAESTTFDRAAVITKLLGLAQSPFAADASRNEAANRATLETLGDEALAALEKSLAAAPTPTPAPVPATSATAAPAISEEAVFAAFPHLKTLSDAEKARAAARRTTLEAALVKARPDRWPTAGHLAGKSLPELEDIAALLPSPAPAPGVQYGLLGVPEAFQRPETDIYAHPPDAVLQIVNAQRKAKGLPDLTAN